MATKSTSAELDKHISMACCDNGPRHGGKEMDMAKKPPKDMPKSMPKDMPMGKKD